MSKKLISLLLTVILFATGVISRSAGAESTIESNPVLDKISDKGENAVEAAEKNDKKRVSSEEIPSEERWKDYIGDIETFVYGLIINQLEYAFDVFPGCVDLVDGSIVYGIAYTDYSNCYVNEDETYCCFDAGFIPFNGELPVPQEDFDSGLSISNLDFTDSKTSFLWAYGSDPFMQHCVVYGQYLQYGVDDDGAVFYKNSDYVDGVCDESIGSLYSYDKARFLLDLDVGTYMRITGVSLFSQLDFDELEKEINRILITQDKNFATVDIVSCANFAQEAIVSYLLSLQEETFLGYNVDELVAAANTLDPLECYRITEKGLITLKLEEGTKASDLTKWLVGTTCVIITAVAIVGSVVFIECPPLSALAGAVAGAAIETFMQVVISDKELDSVDWRKVAIGAAAGALSGFLGPYIYAATGGMGFAYFALDSAIDGFIGGIERATEAWMDGNDAAGVISSFGMGVAIGFGLSAGFKGLAKVVQGIGKGVTKISEKIIPKLTQKVSGFKKAIGEAISTRIGNVITPLKKWADSTKLHSKYITKKITDKQVKRLISQNVDELVDNSVNQLPVDKMVDLNGEEISKKMLKKMAAEADDGTVLAYFVKGDDIIQIVKKNSMVGVVFDPSKYQTVNLPNWLTPNRSINYESAARIWKEQWLKDPRMMPESIAKAISDKGLDLEDISPTRLVSFIKEGGWLIHENIDMISATLVPKALHQEISHSGGVSLAQYLKSHMALEYFDRLVSTAATEIVIAVQ